jgi:hypothetical protein
MLGLTMQKPCLFAFAAHRSAPHGEVKLLPINPARQLEAPQNQGSA